MNKLTEKVFECVPRSDFTGLEVAALFPGSKDRRSGLVKRAIASGEIIHIRRGMYCLDSKYRKHPVSLYSLSQRIYGPSYISLESALSRHGWIPEAVHTITSVSLNKSRDFKTSLGIFSYTRVPQKVFYESVERLSDDAGNVLLMASPVKSLVDYVYVHKKDWSGIEPAVESLRIDHEELESITGEQLEALRANYRSRRVRRFIEGMMRDLKL